MLLEFKCGRTSASVNISKDAIIGHFRGPEAPELVDAEQMIRAALAEPLDLPPLRRALAPGDRVAVALDGGLPSQTALLTPILETFLDAGIEPADVSVVYTNVEEDLAIDLPERFREVEVVRHNHADQDALAYLASTKDGRRIYLNRRIVDADFSIVVGRTGPDSILGIRGPATDLFPGLSNDPSIERARQLAVETQLNRETLWHRQAAEEVAWLAGLLYAVGVALDRNGAPSNIWVGQYQSVQKAADAKLRESWSVAAPKRGPDVVLASVAPSEKPATWSSVAAALAIAGRHAGEAAKLVLLSDLDEPLGPTGRWLIDYENPADVLGRLRTPEARASGESVATAQLLSAINAGRVYLYSKVEPELVESLSMIAVGSPAEVENVLRRCERCLIIEDADRVWE